MDNSIEIVNSSTGKINPIFIRVCNQLIDNNEKLFKFYRPDADKNQTLKELWMLEHRAEIIENSDTGLWEIIKFQTARDMMLFLLKQN